ncbi:MAG: hypothetical protein Q8R38_04665 [Candidatus Omnitrophota bacterium]|nr:hypothetical protein [Candidatus Omnitrophota bacterium]
MDKKHLIIGWIVVFIVLSISSICFSEIIHTAFNEQEVSGFDKQLKKQGIDMPEDGINEIHKIDINNDGNDEYVLTNTSGSGQYFDIIGIYKKDDEKIRDIFDEIKLPLRRSIRDARKETYDLEEGYVGLMRGEVIFERVDKQIFFTLIERSEDRPSPWAYKFLWNKNGIELIASDSLARGRPLEGEAKMELILVLIIAFAAHTISILLALYIYDDARRRYVAKIWPFMWAALVYCAWLFLGWIYFLSRPPITIRDIKKRSKLKTIVIWLISYPVVIIVFLLVVAARSFLKNI